MANKIINVLFFCMALILAFYLGVVGGKMIVQQQLESGELEYCNADYMKKFENYTCAPNTHTNYVPTELPQYTIT